MKKEGNIKLLKLGAIVIILSISLFLFGRYLANFSGFVTSETTVNFDIGDDNYDDNDTLVNNNSNENNEENSNINNNEENPTPPDTNGQDTEKPEKKILIFGFPLFPWIYIIIGITCSLLFLVITIVIILSRRKKNNEQKNSVYSIPRTIDKSPNNSSIPPIKAKTQPPIQQNNNNNNNTNLNAQNNNTNLNAQNNNINQNAQNNNTNLNTQNNNTNLNNTDKIKNQKNENIEYVKYYSKNLSSDPRVRIQYLINTGKIFVENEDKNSAKQVYSLIFEEYQNLRVHDETLYNEILNFNKLLVS
jgi:hypothetical protein